MTRQPHIPRLAGLHPMKETLETIAQNSAKRRGFNEQRLLLDWSQIAGPEIAALCQPVRIHPFRNGKRNAILELRATNAAAAMHVQYQELFILERIRHYLGYAAITRIKASH